MDLRIPASPGKGWPAQSSQCQVPSLARFLFHLPADQFPVLFLRLYLLVLLHLRSSPPEKGSPSGHTPDFRKEGLYWHKLPNLAVMSLPGRHTMRMPSLSSSFCSFFLLFLIFANPIFVYPKSIWGIFISIHGTIRPIQQT